MLANVENMQGASEDTQVPPAVSSDECASNATSAFVSERFFGRKVKRHRI